MSVEQVKIAITDIDGNLIIKSFIVFDGFRPRVEPTPGNIEKEILKSVKFLSWRIISDSDIPANRIYRESWMDTGSGKIDHDMPKARAIHYEKIRREREMELFGLDKEWMKHTGRGDKKAAADVEFKRETLRNITDTISLDVEAAKNTDELFATWPPNVRKPPNFAI